MRHDPAAGAIIIMLRSLKMHGMAQAVGELTEQGSPGLRSHRANPVAAPEGRDGRQRGQIDGLPAVQRLRRGVAFHLLSKLYERASVIITTNLSFGEWAKGRKSTRDTAWCRSSIALALAGQAQEATPSSHRGLKLQPDTEFEFFRDWRRRHLSCATGKGRVNGHSGPQVAFIAIGCHTVGRVGDGLTSRLHTRWHPQGGA